MTSVKSYTKAQIKKLVLARDEGQRAEAELKAIAEFQKTQKVNEFDKQKEIDKLQAKIDELKKQGKHEVGEKTVYSHDKAKGFAGL